MFIIENREIKSADIRKSKSLIILKHDNHHYYYFDTFLPFYADSMYFTRWLLIYIFLKQILNLWLPDGSREGEEGSR